MLPPPKFHSERLVYRATCTSDDGWLAGLMGHPMSMMMASPGVCVPVGDVHSERSKSQLDYVRQALLSIVICLPKSAEAPDVASETRVGWMMLAPLRKGWEHHRRTGFGILLHPDHTGHGYGPEALTWLLEQAFVRMGLNKVDCETIGVNDRAISCYTKIGMKIEGRRKAAFWVEGEWVDEVLFGILADDWWAARRAKNEAEH